MKNVTFIAIALIFVSTIFSSCKNLVPYTDAVKKKYNLDEAKLKKVQFYVSHDIVLHQELSNGVQSTVSKGKIKTINGHKVDEVIIPVVTKGVLVEMPTDKKLLVSYESSDDYYLSFGEDLARDGKFVLLASNWKNESGEVHYNGQIYYTTPDSRYAYLLIDVRHLDDSEHHQRKAKGRKVQ